MSVRQNIPQRKYLIRGIKVKIPSNATVDTTTHLGRITYSGVWDGTFAAATWTNDPAWCLWDLLYQRKIRSWSSRVVIRSLRFFCN